MITDNKDDNKNSEYIVKAKDLTIEKSNKSYINLKKSFLLIGLFVGLLIFTVGMRSNGNINILVLILISLLPISICFITSIENSLIIKDRKIRINSLFKKYRINYEDLIRVRKCLIKDYSRSVAETICRNPEDDKHYLVFEYKKNNSIKEVEFTLLDEEEIDLICSSFITNKDLEKGLVPDDSYFDIVRDIDDEGLKKLIIRDKIKKAIIIIIVVGLAILSLVLFYNYMKNR